MHSRYSTRPVDGLPPLLRRPESYTDPRRVYEIARRRGMDLVTITDHNTLGGSLAIAELPGTFLSSEITARFPEAGCPVHVLVYGVNEATFAELLPLRANLYELVAYLRQTNTVHSLAHPLFDIDRRLSPDLVEKLLVLFNVFEARNGARPALYNHAISDILLGLTQAKLERLADRHGLEPWGERPWEKGLTGGSDDHSGLFVGNAYTAAHCDGTVAGFLQAIRRRSSQPGGEHGNAHVLAHAIYAVGQQHLDARLAAALETAPLVRRLLPALFGDSYKTAAACECARHAVRTVLPGLFARADGVAFERLLLDRVEAPLRGAGVGGMAAAELNARLFDVVAGLARHASALHGDKIIDGIQRRRPGRLAAGALGLSVIHTLSVPYYIAHHNQTRDRRLLEEVRRRFTPVARLGDGSRRRTVLFTDTLSQVNGVALTIRRMLRAARRRGDELTVVTCGEADGEGPYDNGSGTIVRFPAVGSLPIPQYPELGFNFPPLLEVLDFMERGGYDAVHLSTPGAVGWTGLQCARLLHLPVSATYHTAIPQYARALTGSRSAELIAWRYIVAFYRHVDEVLVPSASTERELAARGVPAARLRPLRRWVDTELFTPRRRDLAIWEPLGVEGSVKLLYAGRVSREKNLELVARVYRELVDTGLRVPLVVAGDGPYRRELEHQLTGYPAVFLGAIPQEQLAVVYASSDLFVFASTTDTFGNVVLEAQASGLPVVVTDRGGPRELMIDGVTGVVVPGDDARALGAALRALLQDPARLAQMGLAARHYALANRLDPDEEFALILRGSAPTWSTHARRR